MASQAGTYVLTAATDTRGRFRRARGQFVTRARAAVAKNAITRASTPRNSRGVCIQSSGQRVGRKGRIVTRRRWLLAALLGILAAAAIGWTLLAPRDSGRPASTA